MMNFLIRHLRGSFPGFVAQGMTLAAALFPILVGREDVLVYLLSVAAPVTIVAQAVTLGAPLRLPMAESFARKARLASSLSGILLATSAVSVVFVAVFALSDDQYLRKLVLGFFLLLPCQSLYLLMLAVATCELAYEKLMSARVYYGAFTLSGTVLMGLVEAPPVAFLLVASLGFVCGAIPILWGRLSWGLFQSLILPILGFQGFGTEVVAARYVIGASLISGMSSQIGALATPLLPSHLTGAWAAAVRVTAGLQTVGGQILGPKLDITIVDGLRKDGSELIREAWRKGLEIGSSLGLVCVMTCLGAIAWLNAPSPDSWMPLGAAVVGYSATSVFLAPIDRSLTLLGGQRERLLWDLARAVLGGFLVVLLADRVLLVGLGALGLASLGSYLLLMRSRVAAIVRSGQAWEVPVRTSGEAGENAPQVQMLSPRVPVQAVEGPS